MQKKKKNQIQLQKFSPDKIEFLTQLFLENGVAERCFFHKNAFS